MHPTTQVTTNKIRSLWSNFHKKTIFSFPGQSHILLFISLIPLKRNDVASASVWRRFEVMCPLVFKANSNPLETCKPCLSSTTPFVKSFGLGPLTRHVYHSLRVFSFSCTTIHRYPIFSTRYSIMCKVYTGYCGTSELLHCCFTSTVNI